VCIRSEEIARATVGPCAINYPLSMTLLVRKYAFPWRSSQLVSALFRPLHAPNLLHEAAERKLRERNERVNPI
jgi:hypothetical protein